MTQNEIKQMSIGLGKIYENNNHQVVISMVNSECVSELDFFFFFSLSGPKIVCIVDVIICFQDIMVLPLRSMI